MLSAIDDTGQTVEAWMASRDQTYTCPECKESLVLKIGWIVTPHYAHRPSSGCPLALGESERHRAMKRQMGAFFTGRSIRYEVAFDPDHRADLVIGPWVVECQASPLAIEEWETRTAFYNDLGRAVLWVWDEGRFQTEDGDEYRVPAEIRHCHQQNYGTVYVLGADGELVAAHLRPVTRVYFSDYEGFEYDERKLKTIKRIDSRGVDLARGFVNAGPNRHSLVNFVSGGWWKP